MKMNWLTHGVMGVEQLASAPIRSGTGRASVHTGHVLPWSKQAVLQILELDGRRKRRSPLDKSEALHSLQQWSHACFCLSS